MERLALGTSIRDRLTTLLIDLALRLGVLVLLLYFSFALLRPFISIAIWSVVLTVALYPVYDWMVVRLRGRRRLAAVVLTILSLLIVIGPATWLALGLVDSFVAMSERLDLASLTVPTPPETVKDWPLVGDALYQFWNLASTNLKAALTKIVPQLKPVAGMLLQVTAGAGVGAIKFFIAVIVAGFLFPWAPSLAHATIVFSRKLASARGEKFVHLAAATIRAVSRGVIGISVLQAFLAGLGLMVAGVPAASLITSAVLILGIVQIGPSIVLIPIIVWSWMAMETTAALLFTAYMIPVNLLDNILRPVVIGRGLETPMLVILLGVLGGTIAYGISGLFLGPIVLAVIWELLSVWIDDETASGV